MLFTGQGNLEDTVVELVAVAPRSIKSLHQAVVSQGSMVTLRAVYKAVTQLVSAGVLLKAGKTVRLNQEWVREVRARFSERRLLEISKGEKATYVFNSLEHLDTFWKTVAFELEEKEKDGQIFFYNPHNFWAYLPDRKHSEDAYYRHFAESGMHAFFTVGDETEADREFKRTYQNEYLQIDARRMASFPRTDHLTIYGNYVITVRLSKAFAERADALYSSGLSTSGIIQDILKLRTRARFSIENNPAKAAKLRKQLSLNFYFWKDTGK